jgi:uncharacterized protein YkwD
MNLCRLHWKKKAILILLILLPLACDDGSSSNTQGYPPEAEVEMLSFQLINQDRIQAGAPALILNRDLSAVARAHSADMRDRNYFDHIDPNGGTPSKRLRTAGISFRISGENISRTIGISDPAVAANNNFLSSAAHRNVLLNREFTQAGVGVVRSGTDYWITQNFIGR